MASAPSKLASAAVLLLALWVITYWVTPAPGRNAVRISFAEAPEPAPAHRAPKSVPAPEPVAVRTPTPSSQPETSPILVEVPDDPTSTEPGVTPPTFRMYTTQSGDTFQRIASRFYNSSASWRVIAKANPTVDPNRLGPGVRLYVPVDPENIQGKPASGADGSPTAAPEVPESEFTEYVVQRGDTLSEISKSLYGRATLWQRIVDANPGVDPDRLRPGTTLRIPPPPGAN